MRLVRICVEKSDYGPGFSYRIRCRTCGLRGTRATLDAAFSIADRHVAAHANHEIVNDPDDKNTNGYCQNERQMYWGFRRRLAAV